MVAYVQQKDEDVAFQPPDDADIHVDAALKQVIGSLNALGAQRRMGWILCQKNQLFFSCFFS